MNFEYLIEDIIGILKKEGRNDKKYLLDYTPPHKSYEEKNLENLQDCTNLVPMKRTEFDTHLFQMGAYGYTILNQDYMVRDRYLTPSKAYETDVHELIHTNNEHETRELTRWMLNIYRFPNYYGNLY